LFSLRLSGKSFGIAESGGWRQISSVQKLIRKAGDPDGNRRDADPNE
jgi:hypothetical protein